MASRLRLRRPRDRDPVIAGRPRSSPGHRYPPRFPKRAVLGRFTHQQPRKSTRHTVRNSCSIFRTQTRPFAMRARALSVYRSVDAMMVSRAQKGPARRVRRTGLCSMGGAARVRPRSSAPRARSSVPTALLVARSGHEIGQRAGCCSSSGSNAVPARGDIQGSRSWRRESRFHGTPRFRARLPRGAPLLPAVGCFLTAR